jgi:hypothetical protein
MPRRRDSMVAMSKDARHVGTFEKNGWSIKIPLNTHFSFHIN